MDLDKLLAQGKKELLAKKIETVSPGGGIKVVLNGLMEVMEIKISPSLFKEEKVDYLEKLLKETFNLAAKRAQKIIAQEVEKNLASSPLSNLFNLFS
ncbi:YbaB/EbfC family nucleoid-associated protein [Carboxydothermus pertinax]|uniref:Nucleoid-associated protein n=1 Tax=Carboxydothermus pertinax TaxID=870242 RepID=A0A1L8CT90_9THEO|nr:YbaB/EbfC family nucleoid-associated protein [Carboxydothermus pertinax]GAV22155.1 conserved hypothetical protein [Carboxydothermus pertinax]